MSDSKGMIMRTQHFRPTVVILLILAVATITSASISVTRMRKDGLDGRTGRDAAVTMHFDGDENPPSSPVDQLAFESQVYAGIGATLLDRSAAPDSDDEKDDENDDPDKDSPDEHDDIHENDPDDLPELHSGSGGDDHAHQGATETVQAPTPDMAGQRLKGVIRYEYDELGRITRISRF